MFDECLYIIKVYDTDDTYEYQYGNLNHALIHFNEELSKGNKAVMFRCKDDILERFYDGTRVFG